MRRSDVLARAGGRAEAHVAIGALTLAIAPGVAGVLAARTLGPDGRGQLAVLLALGSVAGSLGLRGIDTALLACGGAPDRIQWLVIRRRSMFVAVLDGGVGAVAAVLVLGSGALLTALIVPLFAAATTLFLLVRASNLAAGDTGIVVRADLLSSVVLLLLAVSAAVLGSGPFGYVVASLVGLVVGVFAGSRSWRHRCSGVCEDSVAQLYSDLHLAGRNAFGARAFQTASFRLDRVVLAATAGSSASGIYAAVVPFAEVATIVPLHLSQLVTSAVARGEDPRRWYRLRTSAIALAIAFTAVLIVILTSAVIVDTVYGAEFADGVATLRILALASLVSVVWRLGESALFGSGRTRPALIASGVAAVLVLGATAVLSSMGAAAAAVASLLGYSAALLLTLGALRLAARE